MTWKLPTLGGLALASCLVAGVAWAQVQAPSTQKSPLGSRANPRQLPVKPSPGPNLPPPAGGILVVETPVFNGGDIERGEKFTHEFVVKNTGTGALHIHAKPG
ncbi:MAG: hypothetical protein AAF533_08595 [Acidobacteriota bacterium]